MYKVYKYTNIHTGQSYIGQTRTSLKYRAQYNGNNYKECRRFYDAIKEYGWNAFESSILKDNLTKKQADCAEMLFIWYFQTTDPKYGYNILHGGSLTSMPKESREIISRKAKERVSSPGYKNPMEGKKHSEETLKIMRDKKTGVNNPMYKWEIHLLPKKEYIREKAVRCIETGEIWNSLTDAANSIGVKKSTLCGQLTGRQKSCAGKHFEYVKF